MKRKKNYDYNTQFMYIFYIFIVYIGTVGVCWTAFHSVTRHVMLRYDPLRLSAIKCQIKIYIICMHLEDFYFENFYKYSLFIF